MVTAHKKASAKANTGVTEKKVTESSKDHHTNHPSWVDMVKVCHKLQPTSLSLCALFFIRAVRGYITI